MINTINNEVDIKNLREQLKKGTFFYFKEGLILRAKIEIVFDLTNNSLGADFNEGGVEIYLDKIKKIKRPLNIVAKFKWCYMLKNYNDECIGYIGEPVRIN